MPKKKIRCVACLYEWEPRKKTGDPVMCPRCHRRLDYQGGIERLRVSGPAEGRPGGS
jgi:hypothetical protein